VPPDSSRDLGGRGRPAAGRRARPAVSKTGRLHGWAFQLQHPGSRAWQAASWAPLLALPCLSSPADAFCALHLLPRDLRLALEQLALEQGAPVRVGVWDLSQAAFQLPRQAAPTSVLQGELGNYHPAGTVPAACICNLSLSIRVPGWGGHLGAWQGGAPPWFAPFFFFFFFPGRRFCWWACSTVRCRPPAMPQSQPSTCRRYPFVASTAEPRVTIAVRPAAPFPGARLAVRSLDIPIGDRARGESRVPSVVHRRCVIGGLRPRESNSKERTGVLPTMSPVPCSSHPGGLPLTFGGLSPLPFTRQRRGEPAIGGDPLGGQRPTARPQSWTGA